MPKSPDPYEYRGRPRSPEDTQRVWRERGYEQLSLWDAAKGGASAPMDPSEQAETARRLQEDRAKERGWRATEAYLPVKDLTPNQRVRLKTAYLAGWDGAKNYHTATKR